MTKVALNMAGKKETTDGKVVQFSLFPPYNGKDNFAFLETGKFGRFMLPAETEGNHIWKVDTGILLRWSEATNTGKIAIGKLIQQGHGTYMGIEVDPKKKTPQSTTSICEPTVTIDSTHLPEQTTVKTFDVGELNRIVTDDACKKKVKPKFIAPKSATKNTKTPKAGSVTAARNVVKRTLGLQKKTKLVPKKKPVPTSPIVVEEDEWTLELRKELLKLYLDSRLGDPKRNYWGRIARNFPGFTKEQVKEKIRCEKRLYDRHKNLPSGSRGVPKPDHWEDLYDCFSQIDDIEPKRLLDGNRKKGKSYETTDDSEYTSSDEDGIVPMRKKSRVAIRDKMRGTEPSRDGDSEKKKTKSRSTGADKVTKFLARDAEVRDQKWEKSYKLLERSVEATESMCEVLKLLVEKSKDK